MIAIRIHGWHPDKAWAAFSTYHPQDFVRRLAMYSSARKPDLEQMADRVRNGDCFDIELSKATDRLDVTSIRSILESLGAETTVV